MKYSIEDFFNEELSNLQTFLKDYRDRHYTNRELYPIEVNFDNFEDNLAFWQEQYESWKELELWEQLDARPF